MPQRRPEEVADLLHSVSIHVLRRAREHDAETQLGPSRLSALSVAVFRGPLTLGELAAAEGVRSATMTGIVNGLERDGLVRRRRHGTDRRAVLVEATARGRRLLEKARRRRIESVAGRIGDLSRAELDLLWRAGEILEGRFGARPWRPVGD